MIFQGQTKTTERYVTGHRL